MIPGGFLAGGAGPALGVGQLKLGSEFAIPIAQTQASGAINVPELLEGMHRQQTAMQTAQFGHEFDMQLMSTIGQGAGDMIKTLGWVIGMGMQFDSAQTINDRRADAQETVAGYQKELGLELFKIQGEANERATKLAPELANIEANKALAIETARLESRERMAAMQGTFDRSFDMGNRRDYFYG